MAEHSSKDGSELHRLAVEMARGLGNDHMLLLIQGMNPKKLSPADFDMLDSLMAQSKEELDNIKPGDPKPWPIPDPKVLYVYVVLYDTKDYPAKYVCRVRHVTAGQDLPGELIACEDSLDKLRAHIPLGLHCMPRHPQDDPVIVECWL